MPNQTQGYPPCQNLDVSRRQGWVLASLACLTLLLLALHVAIGGSMPLSLPEILRQLTLGPGGSDPASVVVWEIRLPRSASAAAIGALLALVGAAFQALFRNPLAEPYIVGVSSGAALGGTAFILLGVSGLAGGLMLTLGGFLGGMAALALVLALAGLRKGAPIERLLVAGVVIGSMLSAVTSLLLILGGRDTNEVLRWLLGSVTPATWPKAGLTFLALALCGAGLYAQSRRLDAMAISEEAASRVGLRVSRLRGLVLTLGSAGTAAAVGSAGVIPFLGLVAPHIVRPFTGESMKRLMPASALMGASLLLASDLLAQRIRLGTELPVGAVTAVLGAPILLLLLGGSRRP
jgi:iron complex transport system permease protein